MNRKNRTVGQRGAALCLVGCLLSGLLPPTPAFGVERTHTLRSHDCRTRAGITVAGFSELKAAIASGSGEIDLILRTGGDWTATESLVVPSGKTVHLRVASGEKVTLTRAGTFLSGALFTVAAGGRLILGSGQVEYAGTDLKTAAQAGSYTVRSDETAGELVIDGGAVWENPVDWAPGTNFGDPSGKSAVLYDEQGNQKKYANTGLTASATLIVSLGTVDIWDGVTLQNNVTTGMYGGAIQSNEGSTLNMFGGQVSQCVVASSSNDTGRGAVFVGKFEVGNWNTKLSPTNTHFNLYGGKITRNAASGGGNQDGGGVSVETGYMDLYGGEVSYNHAGVWYSTVNSGDGGGIMVRNYAQFHMWGGSVDHNFAGGYGGGIVAWNGEVNIHGGEVTRNQASYGGGLAIASSNDQNAEISAKAAMDGGVIAYNEAIQTACPTSIKSTTGVGGGICVGTGTRTQGSALELSGGEIRQNTAANGGGMGVYAGGGQKEGSAGNTAVIMSGDFQLTNNFADRNGNGMYITNLNPSGGNPHNSHYLVTLSGGARVDTNNPVYFENLCKGQVPVRVADILTSEGTAAIFEFADSFWSGGSKDYDKAANGRKVVDFAKDIQENKIALENTAWYLKMDKGALSLQTLNENPQYTIRNGTPVTVDGKVYYRVYASLSTAFREAADGDVLYIFYNTTIGTPAVLSGKHVTLMAESTSSAGRDAGLSGAGPTKTCWLENSDYGYTVMRGNFLKYVGDGKGGYAVSGGAAVVSGGGAYALDNDPNGATAYNVRNDYTITLSRHLYLGESSKGNSAGEGAVIVEPGATLEVGQTATVGMGAGALTFDGNLSAPKEGPMFQTGGTLALHSGVTIKNHSNYSLAHPGAVEVRGGDLTMDEGVTITGNVSPVAGAVYVSGGGRFTMNGGSIIKNDGAMPRYGFTSADGARLDTYDTAYWGQGKYYSGAGAVYNLGIFTLKGGLLSENRGEYGALANLGTGVMDLLGGTVTSNHAQTGTGTGEHSLVITGYSEGAAPAIPKQEEWAENAGSGGGLYQGGGEALVGSGMSISGNTARNGGGLAVGKGRDLTRSVSGYTLAAKGYETITGAGSIAAKVPSYGAEGAVGTAPVKLTVRSGGALTDNLAEGLGGGIFASGTGDGITVEGGVILRRNKALAGGGVAALDGGSIVFSNEATENTAVYGGGIYVGGGSSVSAQGSITSNQARHGGGAYVDSGSGLPEGPGPAEATSAAGRLILDGALVNNNRLEGQGFGVGIYSRGDLELTGAEGSQPTVSYNDRVYLEAGRVVTLSSTYDIAQSGQNENNKLTLESRQTQNGTQIVQAFSSEQAAAVLTSGFMTHYTHPMAQNQEDKTQLELNAVPVVYYDRFSDRDGLGSHRVEVPYASGDTVIFQNFSVGEDFGFAIPSGMSFLRWVTIDGSGRYLDSDGRVVDSPDKAHTYYAGNTIMGIQSPVYLEAVYGTVSYAALLQVLDETGAVVHDTSMGEITLGGATYNSSTGEYSYAMGTPMNVNALPATGAGSQTVLQELTVYERASQQEGSEDLYVNGSWWTPAARAEMEEETLSIPGGVTKTVRATGRMTGVKVLKPGAVAALDEKGNFTYTASNRDILVRAQFKPAMVRLELAEENVPVSFTGYYDTMHEAVTAAAGRIGKGQTEDWYTFTLLAPNSIDENGDPTVLYYGETGKDPSQCVDNDIVSSLGTDTVLHITYDLNGYVLDYQYFGERNLKKYDMTVKNGTVVYNGNEDKTNPLDPKPSAFRVAEGTLTLEGVKILTTAGAPNGGNNDKVYSAKVMEKGTLNIGRGCALGDVFIYTDPDIKNVPVGGVSQNSGHVTVTNTFVEGRRDPVAVLCLDNWDFQNQVRWVIELSDSLAAREGVSIRRMFTLKDASLGRQKDNAKYWFIGTDGKLYKKAAAVLPELRAESRGQQDPLTRYWDYQDKRGSAEIGHPAPTDEDRNGMGPAWINGYPFFYDYYSTYGFDSRTAVSLTAQLLDGAGDYLEIDRGTVAFTVSRVTYYEDRAEPSHRRSFSGTTGLDSKGSAVLSFPILSELPVTEQLDLKNWTAPKSYYVVTAAWAGAGQYAPEYAEFWNYTQGLLAEDYAGVAGSTLTGALRLSIQGKALSGESVEIAAITPGSVEYVGPKGVEAGYTSAPTVGRVVDDSLDRAMIPGTDYHIYFAALTKDAAVNVVRGEDGSPLICRYQGEDYFYIAGPNGGKIYYSNGGEGGKDGQSPATAKDLNGAPAGSYSVALEAETLPDSNYMGQSGWKNTLFTIRPYSNTLSINGPNHVVVGPGESYSERITAAFTGNRSAITITDRYGNELPLSDCAFTFAPISGSAKLDENGWPSVEGLYNLVVTATGHRNGTMKLPDVSLDTEENPDYAETAAGYLAILITNKQLDVFFVPQTISAPYTGQIYTSDMVKVLDGRTPTGYQVWRTGVDAMGNPVNAAGQVISVEDIPTLGKDALRLEPSRYRVEIGSPQHTPRDVGAYTMVVTDVSGGYIGIGTLSITSQTIGEIKLSESSATYTGVDHAPLATVTDSQGRVLMLNRDYVLRLTDAQGHVVSAPINAGSYTYTAVGINNYVGSADRSVTYTVEPKKLDNSDQDLTAGIRGVILDAPSYAVSNGVNAVIPRYSLYYNGMTLIRGDAANADYTQTITKDGKEVVTAKEPGTYIFTVTGKGNYAGQTRFVLTVELGSGELRITNAAEYTYNGGSFADYRWQENATVNWTPDGGTTQSLDPYRFQVTLERIGPDGGWIGVDTDDVLDAGIYLLTMKPQADYAAQIDGLEEYMAGSCIFQIQRRTVTIWINPSAKTYGDRDPDFTGQGYTTDLAGVGDSGFYDHDQDRISGQFGRNTGENVRNSGYRYTLGSFSAGDNYVLTVSVETVFTIEPKDLSFPTAGVEDTIQVSRRESMAYTGYGLEPIQSVSYAAEQGKLALTDQASYLLTYERWLPGQSGCTPDCALEGCDHGWEPMAATPTDVAWYRATLDADACITAPDNYVGSRSFLFEIQAQGGDLELAIEGDDVVTYRRGDYTPVVTVKREGFVLAKEYYALSYSFAPADGSPVRAAAFVSGETKLRDAGVYTIYAAGSGNYAGSAGSVVFMRATRWWGLPLSRLKVTAIIRTNVPPLFRSPPPEEKI